MGGQNGTHSPKREFDEDYPAKGGVVFLCLNSLSRVNYLPRSEIGAEGRKDERN